MKYFFLDVLLYISLSLDIFSLIPHNLQVFLKKILSEEFDQRKRIGGEGHKVFEDHDDVVDHISPQDVSLVKPVAGHKLPEDIDQRNIEDGGHKEILSLVFFTPCQCLTLMS